MVAREERDPPTLPNDWGEEITEPAAAAGRPISAEIPVESQHAEQGLVQPSEEPYEAKRREQKLALAYRKQLEAGGSAVVCLGGFGERASETLSGHGWRVLWARARVVGGVLSAVRSAYKPFLLPFGGV